MQLYERHNIIIASRQATTDQLVQSLCDHELDCVLGRASAAAGRENLWHEVLYTQRPVLIGHDKLLQRLQGRRLDWPALATMDWILASTVGRAACREGVWPSVLITEGAAYLKKKKQ